MVAEGAEVLSAQKREREKQAQFLKKMGKKKHKTDILVPELPASMTSTYLGSGVRAAARRASANASASRQRRSSGEEEVQEGEEVEGGGGG